MVSSGSHENTLDPLRIKCFRSQLSDSSLSSRKGEERDRYRGPEPSTSTSHECSDPAKQAAPSPLHRRENRPREADFLKFILASWASVHFPFASQLRELACVPKLLKREGAALKFPTQTTTYTSPGL